MSIPVIVRVIDADLPDISVHDKMVLTVLARFADKTGHNAFPSWATIARAGLMTTRQVAKSLAKLKTTGYIVPVANVGGGKPGSATRYTLNLDRLTGEHRSPLTGEHRAETGEHGSETGEHHDRDGCTPFRRSVIDLGKASVKELTTPQATSSLAPQGGQPAARTRRGRLPDDFNLTPEREQAAREAIEAEHGRRASDGWLRRQFEQFRDEFASRCGPTAYQSDWPRVWVRFAVKAVELAPRHVLQAELAPVAAPRATVAADAIDIVPSTGTDYAAMFPLSDLKEKSQ